MAKKQPRIYFDHKAEITKIEGDHKECYRKNAANENDDFEWKASSHLSWEAFVQKWENRHISN